MMWIALPERAVLRVGGVDRLTFLQGLITQDLHKLAKRSGLYSALLTPQGRFCHDFFITDRKGSYFLECERVRLGDLQQLLTRYRLRNQVELEDLSDQLFLYAWLGEVTPHPLGPCEVLYRDPRLDSMGWRAVTPCAWEADGAFSAYDLHRLYKGIPEGSRDMEVARAIPLEYGLDRLNAIDFQKGCYLGQELTARTHYTGIVRKGVVPVTFEGPAPAFKEPVMQGDVAVGEMLSHQGGWGLIRIRLEALEKQEVPLICGGALITPHSPVL